MYQRFAKTSFRPAGGAMAWKATGQPTVRKQRDKWVVRVDGIDTATGNTARASSARTRHSDRRRRRRERCRPRSRRPSGDGELVGAPLRRRHVPTSPSKAQRAVRVGDPATSRTGSARSRCRRSIATTSPTWIDASRPAGKLSQRSVQICRTVLRAALTRSGRRRTDHPRRRRPGSGCLAPLPSPSREGGAWRGLPTRSTGSSRPRRSIGGRSRSGSASSTGLRRSEVLALRWDDLDVEGEHAAHRREPRRHERGCRVEQRQERTLAADDPDRRRHDASVRRSAARSRQPNASPPATSGRTTT